MAKERALFILIALFSLGSWIDINGIWVELPVFVNLLPEGWYLPSYIVVCIKLANIGPLIYSIVRAFVSVSAMNNVIDPLVSLSLLAIDTVCCGLLAVFWDATVGHLELPVRCFLGVTIRYGHHRLHYQYIISIISGTISITVSSLQPIFLVFLGTSLHPAAFSFTSLG